MFIKSLSLAFILFLSNVAVAQQGDWVADSLDLFADHMMQAVENEDPERLIELQGYVYLQGVKSLKAPVFELFYALTNNPEVQKHSAALAQIHHNLGNLEFYRGRMEDANSTFTKALTAYQLSGAHADAAGMAMNLGIIQERSGEYDSAIVSYQRAMPIFLDAGDTAAIAVCLENIGISNRFIGKLQLALEYFDQTDSLLSQITPKDHIRWSYLYYNYCQVFTALGEYDKALDYGLRGLRISEANKDERQISVGYIELQNIYNLTDDDENWLKYADKALTFAKETTNNMRVAELHLSLASYFADRAMLDTASVLAEASLAYYRENDVAEGYGQAHLMRGRIYYDLGDYNKAIQSFETALNSFPSSSIEVSRAYQSLGSSYMELKNYGKADTYLRKALALRLESGELQLISNTYETLSENSSMAGDYKSAYEYLGKFKEYQDSLFNERKASQLARIETEYETEKKDQEIAGLQQEREIQQLIDERRTTQIYLAVGGLFVVMILAFFYYKRARLKQRANQLLEAKNQEIEKQNAEKETLLKEIHHRVKNNLQIISSLLSMQTRALHDEHAIGAMKESQSRVKTMALIHEKLYQYDNLSRINMKEYMNQLSDFLAHTYRTDKQIQVVIESDDVSLDIDTAVPLGLIANELLSNAWKYAFQDMEQGEIRIILKRQGENTYRLEISDTGAGISEEVDLEKSKSLGLKLVRSLTRQIQGNLVIQPNPGTTFLIDFRETPMAA